MSARAGTPLARIEAELAAKGQMLAFEPIDLGPVARQSGRAGGTIGAVFATNLSGSRRVQAGGARDHLLGIDAVTGNGHAVPLRRPRDEERHRLRPVRAALPAAGARSRC